MQHQADLRSWYILNTGIADLEKADAFRLVGSQLRVEAAMVNARIRKAVLSNFAKGHHGDRNAYRANIVFPSSAFPEKEGTYANTEGRTQQTIPAVQPLVMPGMTGR